MLKYFFIITTTIFIIYVILKLTILNRRFCEDISIFTTPKRNLSKNGPKVLMIAGTHGNENSGVFGLDALINKIKTNKINFPFRELIIIPRINKCGILLNKREIPYEHSCRDINRCYPVDLDDKPKNIISEKVLKYVSKSDLIIDFHDAWGFYKERTGSIGSTITPSGTNLSNQISNKIILNLNKTIDNNIQKYSIIHKRHFIENNILGTLSTYCSFVNKRNYLLIETSGQNNKLPLNIRLNHIDIVINTIINYFKKN